MQSSPVYAPQSTALTTEAAELAAASVAEESDEAAASNSEFDTADDAALVDGGLTITEVGGEMPVPPKESVAYAML